MSLCFITVLCFMLYNLHHHRQQQNHSHTKKTTETTTIQQQFNATPKSIPTAKPTLAALRDTSTNSIWPDIS